MRLLPHYVSLGAVTFRKDEPLRIQRPTQHSIIFWRMALPRERAAYKQVGRTLALLLFDDNALSLGSGASRGRIRRSLAMSFAIQTAKRYSLVRT